MLSIKLDQGGAEDQVRLNHTTLKKLGFKSSNLTLHFGTLSKQLNIVPDSTLEPDIIVIPQKLGPEITIPALPYDHYFKENHLFIGPVIGYIVVPRYYENPALVSLRFLNYERVKGLIILFRPDKSNLDNDVISGKYFDPQTKTFIKGVFPYPSVIYNRTPLSGAAFQRLQSHVGNNIFNYPFFNTDKWDFWNWMSIDPSISTHLPQTTKLSGIESLVTALKRHKAVYIKPTRLSQGRGIFYAAKSGSTYILSDRYGRKYLFKSPEQLSSALQKKIINSSDYIIQQAIPFKTAGGNKIDFRVYVQKDYSGQWKFSGMETKVAKKDSIISNSSNRKLILPGKTALSKYFGLKQPQVLHKVEEISQICIQVLKIMEQHSHHLGDAAIDLVLDSNHKIWLLEVQLNYAGDKKARRSEAERQILPAVLPTPFEYAKALSGF